MDGVAAGLGRVRAAPDVRGADSARIFVDRAGTFGPDAADAPSRRVIGPVGATDGGQHLVVVEQRRQAIPFDEVRDGLAAAMLGEAMEQVTEEYRREMRVERP